MRGKKQIICILCGIGAFLAAEWSGRAEKGDITSLSRPGYGQEELNCPVKVKGLDEDEVTVEIQVGARQMKPEEADRIFSDVMDKLPELILGENESLKEVRSDLNLITWLSEYGIRLRWFSEDDEVMDSFGHITAENLPEGGKPLALTVSMAHENIKQEYQILLRVKPAKLTEREEQTAGFQKLLTALDENSRTEDSLKLPDTYNGKKLRYRMPDDSGHAVLLVLGVILAVLCTAKEKMDAGEAAKRRRNQMMLDYSEIVSKLMIFIGAGMTVFMAWERIVLEYERMKAAGRKELRFAYEELCTTYYQIKSGISEGRAYRDFGRRTGLNCYLKLSGLL